MPINDSKEHVPGDHTARSTDKIASLEITDAFADSWYQPTLFASVSFIKNPQWERNWCVFLMLAV